MNNKYLDKMIIQPDYVVVYDENKGFYHGNTLNREDYKKLQYDMSIYDTKVKLLVGYAASKSHPTTPVKVYISLDMRDCLGKRLEHSYIRVSKVVNEQSEHYQGKHDLFIYSDYSMAVLAGKEMSFMDSIDEYIESVGSKVKEYFPDSKFNRNFDFKWLQDKFNTYKYKEHEYFDKDISQLNDVFKRTVDNSKETVKNTVNTVTDYAKSGIEQFIKELELADIVIPKQKPEYAKNEEDFALYKQLTSEYAVLLKHRKRNGKSRYTVNIIKLILDTNKTYDITFEQFYDIYDILNEGGEGRLKFNSINDVLGNQIFEEKPIEAVKEKPKKTNPIQFCTFRKEDIQKEESTVKKSRQKFQIGDKVYNKSKGYGYIIDVKDTITGDGKKRKSYKVQFGDNNELNIWRAWSYELEKA